MVGPDEPTDLVVEFPKGTCASRGIRPGDAVRLALTRKTIARDIRMLTQKILK